MKKGIKIYISIHTDKTQLNSYRDAIKMIIIENIVK